jgi:hypothetical protein
VGSLCLNLHNRLNNSSPGARMPPTSNLTFRPTTTWAPIIRQPPCRTRLRITLSPSFSSIRPLPPRSASTHTRTYFSISSSSSRSTTAPPVTRATPCSRVPGRSPIISGSCRFITRSVGKTKMSRSRMMHPDAPRTAQSETYSRILTTKSLMMMRSMKMRMMDTLK